MSAAPQAQLDHRPVGARLAGLGVRTNESALIMGRSPAYVSARLRGIVPLSLEDVLLISEQLGMQAVELAALLLDTLAKANQRRSKGSTRAP